MFTLYLRTRLCMLVPAAVLGFGTKKAMLSEIDTRETYSQRMPDYRV